MNYTTAAPLMMRASITLDGKDDRSSVNALKINRMNIDRKIHTASLPGLEDPITAFTKPCSVKGKPKTSTKKFIPLNLRKYIKATMVANTIDVDLKKI